MEPDQTAPGHGAEPSRWRWTTRDGWWGYHDRRSPLGSVDWAMRVLSGDVPAEAFNERPGSRTLRVEAASGEGSSGDGASPHAYVKHTSRTVWSALTHLSGSEALRVRRLSGAISRRGIGVPAVRMALTRVGPRAVENLLVMDAVQGDSLGDLLDGASPRDLVRALRLTAAETAALHNAGFSHGDLVPGNLIITGGPRGSTPPRPESAPTAPTAPAVVFIDNDRTRRVWGPWVFRARFRNVSQMVYRLMLADRQRGGTGGCARVFLKHYLAHAREPAAVRQGLRRVVERKARRRLANRLGAGSGPPHGRGG